MKRISQLHVRFTHDEWLALLLALVCFVAALGMMTIAEAKPSAGMQATIAVRAQAAQSTQATRTLGAPMQLADVVPPTGGQDGDRGGSSDGTGGTGGSSTGGQTAPEGEDLDDYGASGDSTSGDDRYPQTGTFPILLAIFGLGIALAVVWFALSFRKPRKLGGSKGDVW